MFGAIDIGGTKLLAAVAGDDLRPQAPVRRSTPDGDPVGTLAAMLDDVRGGTALRAIAVASPGPFDREHGATLNPPNVPRAWLNLPLRHVVYYKVSTGIGSGVVHDGRLVVGRHDTEGGHQVLWPSWLGSGDGGPPVCGCGGRGCLEGLASGSAILRRFGVRPEDLDDQAAWDDVGRWLGLAVVNATALHDPDAVVFGGGVCNAWDRFWPSMAATIESNLRLQPQPRVLRAALGEERNLWGALALLREEAGP